MKGGGIYPEWRGKMDATAVRAVATAAAEAAEEEAPVEEEEEEVEDDENSGGGGYGGGNGNKELSAEKTAVRIDVVRAFGRFRCCFPL